MPRVLIPSILGSLLLAGCTAAPLAGGAAGGALATFVAVNADADTALKGVKPLNQGLCLLEPFKPKTAAGKAAVAAFCSHLPDTTAGLLTQIFAVVEAVDAAEHPVTPEVAP